MSLRQRIYDYIRNNGILGATDEELATVLRASGNSVRPRRGELIKDGLIHEAGYTRRTVSGLPAIVWVAHEQVCKERCV